jgi:hypothetical protein
MRNICILALVSTIGFASTNETLPVPSDPLLSDLPPAEKKQKALQALHAMQNLAITTTSYESSSGKAAAVKAALEALEDVGEYFSVIGDIFGFVDLFFDPNAEVMNKLNEIESQITNLRTEMEYYFKKVI